MVDKYKSGKIIFFQMSREEAMAFSARYPLDFLKFTTHRQTNTRNFDPEKLNDRMEIGIFESHCDRLAFSIKESQKRTE